MGLIVDTGVLIFIERRKMAVDWPQWFGVEQSGISAITVSELLVGASRANNQTLRDYRESFLQAILESTDVYDFTVATARIHAALHADLQMHGQIIGAHDLIIAATALEHGHAVLTTNRREFDRVTGLAVIEFPGLP